MTAVARGDGPTEPPDRHGTGGGDAVARALDPDGELRSEMLRALQGVQAAMERLQNVKPG